MRAYLKVSAGVFALVVSAHVARIALEGASTLKEPAFLVSTLIAAAMAAWGLALAFGKPR